MARVKKVVLTGYGLHQIFTTALARFDAPNKSDMWTEPDYEASDEIASALRPHAGRKAARDLLAKIGEPKPLRKPDDPPATVIDEDDAAAAAVASIDAGDHAVTFSPSALDWIQKRLQLTQTLPLWAGPRVRMMRALRNAVDVDV